MWRCEPRRVKFALGCLHLCKGLHLPAAVVDVVELFDALGLDLAGAGDRRTGEDTPRKRARVHACRAPPLGDAASDRQGLGLSALGQGQVLPAAEAGRMNAFDVAVANQDDLGQCAVLFATIKAPPSPGQILACARSIAS